MWYTLGQAQWHISVQSPVCLFWGQPQEGHFLKKEKKSFILGLPEISHFDPKRGLNPNGTSEGQSQSPGPLPMGLTLPSLQGFRSFQKVCIWVRSTLLRGMDTSPMGSLRLKRS